MNDALAHYGVSGMHWYERRYQNKDGSLTPEGRIHYGYSSKPRHGFHRNSTDKNSKLSRSSLKTLNKIERLNELHDRIDDEQTYKNLVNRYGERGLERILKDVDKGDAYLRALSKEHTRQEVVDAVKATVQMASPFVSFIPDTATRASIQLGLSSVNALLNTKFNEIKLTEKDAFNIAELLTNNRITLSDSLMDKIVESDVFDTFGYATESINDIKNIKKKREISPIIQHSWGTNPEQKKREREYNHEYYETHQEKWLKYRNKHRALAREQDDYTSENASAMNEAAKQAAINKKSADKYNELFIRDSAVQITMEIGATLVDLILQDLTRR